MKKNGIFRHYEALLSCSLFAAPRTPVRPYRIREDTEVIEIITGGTVFFPDRAGREYGTGTIFWHRPGEYTVWDTTAENPYRCLAMTLSTDGGPCPVPRVNRWGGIPELSTFTEDMLNFVRSGELHDEAVFCYCLGTLMRQLMKRPVLPRPLRLACRTIGSDPAANIPVAGVAAAAGVSVSRLFALFREYLHTSPHRYQLMRKLDMGKALLLSRKEIPIKQISEMSGFSSLELFYRRFRRYTGVTPAEFRNEAGAFPKTPD